MTVEHPKLAIKKVGKIAASSEEAVSSIGTLFLLARHLGRRSETHG
jgi:hypothetical protein